MAQRPPPGRCVHCLNSSEEMTWDHVFPQSWYPEATPRDLEKWKAPSCRPCNNAYSKLEDYLLLRLGVGLDPNDEASRGIVQRALRSIDPTAGRDERDAEIRRRRRRALLKEAFIEDAIPSEGLIPGFDQQGNTPTGQRIGFTVPVDDLARLCEKIVRGLTYVEDGQFIEPPYQVSMQMLQAEAIPQFEEMIRRHAVVHSCGPGIDVRRAVPDDDRRMAVLGLTIWGRLHLSAFVTPPER